MCAHFIRPLLALLGLIVCGAVQASIPAFEGYRTASDGELDSMRGGFEVNVNGMQLLLAFSVEQLTYINGELVSSMKFSPLALILDPGSGAAAAASTPPAGSSAGNAGAQSTSPAVDAAPLPVAAGGDSQSGPAPVVSTQVINNQAYVTLVQNGTGNSFALPESLNALTTVIQNSVNDQVISNVTVMNATLSIQLEAAMARLNEAISQATAAGLH